MKRSSVIKCIKLDEFSFEEKALSLFEYQYQRNQIYRKFVEIVRGEGFKPKTINDIPFLPIALFKYRKIQSDSWVPETSFHSSGTTGSTRSIHLIRDLQAYLSNTMTLWEDHFPSLSSSVVAALLPNYQDNPHSSLIAMVDHFMKMSKDSSKRYFRDNYAQLKDSLDELLEEGKRVVLFGVSFALLNYSEECNHVDASNLIVVETGGMKRFQKEITRQELHSKLRSSFKNARIISEYGMTECLSQCYCTDGEYFLPNRSMQIVINEPTDSTQLSQTGRRGRINIIDLANIDTISFIATDDMGYQNDKKETAILGRLSNSDLRGCNYLL